MVDFNSIVVFDHSPIVKLLVDLIFSQSVFDVVVLHLVAPAVIKVMNFAGDLAAVFQVKGFVHLAEATLSKNRKDQVLVVKHGESLASVNTAVL